MTLSEFIKREITKVRQNSNPNAITIRFVQLRELERRSDLEEDEYRLLLGLMRARWRWAMASSQAPA